MMTFLLQFFLTHECINQNHILDWYNSNDTHGYMGFQEARQLTEPFIKSLSTKDTAQTGIITPVFFNKILLCCFS